jgi:hypothetical protein
MSNSHRHRVPRFARRAAIATMLLATGTTPVAVAGGAASQASAASIQSLSLLPEATIELMLAGGRFSVVALRPVGNAVEAVLHASATGAEIVVRIPGAVAGAASLTVGSAIEISAVTGGFLLRVGAEAIAFVADAEVASMVHRSEIRR